MATHTPGPWKHDGEKWNDDSYKEGKAWVSTDREYPGSLLICRMADRPPDNGEMELGEQITFANARLIASAPELLKACKLALENLEPVYPMDHLVMKSLRAAIAKATA
jgi:hypothetical protein